VLIAAAYGSSEDLKLEISARLLSQQDIVSLLRCIISVIQNYLLLIAARFGKVNNVHFDK
jgi:hypothetical protein